MSLIEEAKNRNPDAFDRLMRNELQRMYRIAISMLQNEEDAADAIQETVLKCWQKIGQLKQEAYADADFSVAYYINVSEIVRDEQTGCVKEIKGEKVDRQTYERSEAELWQGEQFTTLAVKDYDKIYSDDNPEEALAKCYMKHRK